MRKHGKTVAELEALSPGILQKLLTEAIDSVIDIKAYNGEIDKEKEDSYFLAKQKTRLVSFFQL